MIIDIPVLSAAPSNIEDPPQFFINNSIFSLSFLTGTACLFYQILPSTYLGASIDWKLYWTGPGTVTWSITLQRLLQGSAISTYSFNPEQTVVQTGGGVGVLSIATINMTQAEMGNIVDNDFFRLKVKLNSHTSSGGNRAQLINIAAINGA